MDEAAVMHSALVSAFEAFLPLFDSSSRFERRPGYIVLACPSMPLPHMNGVWLETAEPDLPELARARSAVESLGAPFWVQARASLTPDAGSVAAPLGLLVAGTEPGMVLRPGDIGDPVDTPLAIERVEDAGRLRAARDVAADGFEVRPELFGPMYTRDVLDAPGVSVYVGLVEREAVCTAFAYFDGASVGIFSVATSKGFRRRGFGYAVTRRACSEAFAAGAELAWLQSSPDGDPVYRRLGFRQVETYLQLRPAEPSASG